MLTNMYNPQPRNFLLQRVGTITDIQNWSKCKKFITMGCQAPNSMSTIEPLHLRIREHRGTGNGSIRRARGPGYLLPDSSLLDSTRKLYTWNFKKYDHLNKICLMRAPTDMIFLWIYGQHKLDLIGEIKMSHN